MANFCAWGRERGREGGREGRWEINERSFRDLGNKKELSLAFFLEGEAIEKVGSAEEESEPKPKPAKKVLPCVCVCFCSLFLLYVCVSHCICTHTHTHTHSHLVRNMPHERLKRNHWTTKCSEPLAAPWPSAIM